MRESYNEYMKNHANFYDDAMDEDTSNGSEGTEHWSDKYEELDISEGTKHWAVVQGVTHFGAFVRLEHCDYDALLHIREMADHYVDHPSDCVAEGQKIQVVVLPTSAENVSNNRLRVSTKPSRLKKVLKEEDTPAVSEGTEQWSDDDDMDEDDTPQELDFSVGTEHMAVVQGIKDFGAFVRLEHCDYDALLHIREIADHYVDHPSDCLRKGQIIPVVVLPTRKDKLQVSAKPSRFKKVLKEDFDPVTVVVFGLPDLMEEEEMISDFGQYGTIVDVDSRPAVDSGDGLLMAFITFQEREAAVDCIKNRNRTTLNYRIGTETYEYRIGVKLSHQQSFKRDLQAQLDEEYERNNRMKDQHHPLMRRARGTLRELGIPDEYF